MDSADFDCDVFSKNCISSGNLKEIISLENKLSKEIHEIQGKMRNLVYENYGKFLESSVAMDTLRVECTEMSSFLQAAQESCEKAISSKSSISNSYSISSSEIVENYQKMSMSQTIQRMMNLSKTLEKHLREMDDDRFMSEYKSVYQRFEPFMNEPLVKESFEKCKKSVQTICDRWYNRISEVRLTRLSSISEIKPNIEKILQSLVALQQNNSIKEVYEEWIKRKASRLFEEIHQLLNTSDTEAPDKKHLNPIVELSEFFKILEQFFSSLQPFICLFVVFLKELSIEKAEELDETKLCLSNHLVREVQNILKSFLSRIASISIYKKCENLSPIYPTLEAIPLENLSPKDCQIHVEELINSLMGYLRRIPDICSYQMYDYSPAFLKKNESNFNSNHSLISEIKSHVLEYLSYTLNYNSKSIIYHYTSALKKCIHSNFLCEEYLDECKFVHLFQALSPDDVFSYVNSSSGQIIKTINELSKKRGFEFFNLKETRDFFADSLVKKYFVFQISRSISQLLREIMQEMRAQFKNKDFRHVLFTTIFLVLVSKFIRLLDPEYAPYPSPICEESSYSSEGSHEHDQIAQEFFSTISQYFPLEIDYKAHQKHLFDLVVSIFVDNHFIPSLNETFRCALATKKHDSTSTSESFDEIVKSVNFENWNTLKEFIKNIEASISYISKAHAFFNSDNANHFQTLENVGMNSYKFDPICDGKMMDIPTFDRSSFCSRSSNASTLDFRDCFSFTKEFIGDSSNNQKSVKYLLSSALSDGEEDLNDLEKISNDSVDVILEKLYNSLLNSAFMITAERIRNEPSLSLYGTKILQLHIFNMTKIFCDGSSQSLTFKRISSYLCAQVVSAVQARSHEMEPLSFDAVLKLCESLNISSN